MNTRRGFAAPARRARGLTLVELMVAMALALLVSLASLAALLSSVQGGKAVDQAAQLRDSSRFGTELVRRVALQAGFESMLINTSTREGSVRWGGGDPKPDVEGFNNALVPAVGDPTAAQHGSRAGGCTGSDTSCTNGSDVLIVRHQGSSLGGTADGSVINCAGEPVGDAITAEQRPTSVFHVRTSASGEPTLVCSYTDAGGTVQHRELIEGVEVFQVLYGVDGVTPGSVPPTGAAPASVVQRYLRADQITIAGNPAATRANWRRVRTLRIGMILRGPVGSAIVRSTPQTAVMYPLGELLASNGDAFSSFTTPADGRLRQEVTFTVVLRNYQGV
jgi:type IV pilus assembly protein PilW